MDKYRSGGTVKFRANAVWGIGVLVALVLWGAGCGRTSSEHGQFPPNAEGLFLAGLRPPAGDTTRLLRNAHYLKLMGRTELALRELEAAYQQDPANIRVLNALALACDEMGEYSRAQKLYQEALALDVSNQALNNNLCFSYYLAGQWDKAEACFRQALTRNPDNITARNNLGLLLCRRGRTEEARRLWQERDGSVAAQKKMQQVMAALGLGEPSHYAQAPVPAPIAAAPPQQHSTPPAPLAQDTNSAKPWLSAPETKAPVPAARPAKAPEPLKLAANPTPAAQPDKETPALKTAAKPASSPEPAPAVKKQSEPVAPKPAAMPAASQTAPQKKPVAQAAAAAPAKAQSPPAPPKQTADTDKKPAPATTPPPPPKPEKIKLSSPAAPVRLTGEKLAQSGIEVLNGSGAHKLAHQTRSMLKEEGFKVVSIGNYRDFGAENTVIFYSPGTEEVARALSAKFFPKSRLETGKKFAKGADIKIVLGKDAVTPSAVAVEPAPAAEKIAAAISASPPEPKPAPGAAAPVPAAVQAKAPAPAPVIASSSPAVKVAARETQPKPYLTAAELAEMGIDIRNGTPAQDLARKTRSMLAQEGFNVVHIGNHIDFGAERTVIFYRPGAEKMARNLSVRFFSNSAMEQSAKLPADVAVKVLLGKDLLQRPETMAKLDD